MSDEGSGGANSADFAAFVRAHSTTLFRAAMLLTGNRYEAEDLLQDTLTNLYPKWERVRAADEPVAYVRRALTNRFVSRRRSPAMRDAATWELPDTWDGRDLGESVARSAALWQLLGTLPERQRAAVVLRFFYDASDEDAAATLGCRPVSVRSLVSRGVAALRAAYYRSAAAEGSYR